MEKYFSQLRPMERRLAVAVAVVVLLILNGWFIWPHFSDWGKLQSRLTNAKIKLQLYQATIAQTPAYEAQVKTLENGGGSLASEDQAVNFVRTIQTQSTLSHVQIARMYQQPPRTNDAFFISQVQNVSVIADDQQLVDFLYKLGSGSSMIRVSDLELQPDRERQHLNANMKLVASYQKSVASKNLKSATVKAK